MRKCSNVIELYRIIFGNLMACTETDSAMTLKDERLLVLIKLSS